MDVLGFVFGLAGMSPGLAGMISAITATDRIAELGGRLANVLPGVPADDGRDDSV